MAELSTILTRNLDRVLSEIQNRQLLIVREGGWTQEQLEVLCVLCVLNSFYQIVLGPLASSAREHTGQLGSEIPVLHGSMLFDAQRARDISSGRRHFSWAALLGRFMFEW